MPKAYFRGKQTGQTCKSGWSAIPITFLPGNADTYVPPSIVIDTLVYDPDEGPEERHPFKIELSEPGICIIPGDDSVDGGEGDKLSIVMERHKDGKYLILVHGDAGDPSCRIEITTNKVRVFSNDSDNLIHEVQRHG